jgi:hypothetical protein
MSAVTHEEWEAGYVVAYIWYCGDEECACYQPVIEQASSNREVGYPWVHWKTLWSGTFVTTEGTSGGWPDGIDFEALVSELKQAAKDYPVTRWVLG